MLIIMKSNADKDKIDNIITRIQDKGINAKLSQVGNRNIIICAMDNENYVDLSFLKRLDGVAEVKDISSQYKFTSKDYKTSNTIINIDNVKIGGKENITIIAGPCSIESKEHILETAYFLKENNVNLLRGGVFKPRTSPYTFQGLGMKGLKYLKEASEKTGLKTVCEVMETKDIPMMMDCVDILQIGTRNMYNYPLLKELGKINKPIILKRGICATVHEWLMSAEYIMKEGNHNIILCERGIRTFNTYTRNTLDISVIPYIKQISHLPIIADPSHSAGISSLVSSLALASIAAGADGVMVEIHKEPENAISDSEQALSFSEFLSLKKAILEIAKIR